MVTANSKKTLKHDKQFKPGQSGNPTGRPKKIFELAEKCRDITPQVIDRLINIATNGKDNDASQACKTILEYGYGKAPQTVNLNHSGEITHNLFDKTQRQALIDEYIKNRPSITD